MYWQLCTNDKDGMSIILYSWHLQAYEASTAVSCIKARGTDNRELVYLCVLCIHTYVFSISIIICAKACVDLCPIAACMYFLTFQRRKEVMYKYLNAVSRVKCFFERFPCKLSPICWKGKLNASSASVNSFIGFPVIHNIGFTAKRKCTTGKNVK